MTACSWCIVVERVEILLSSSRRECAGSHNTRLDDRDPLQSKRGTGHVSIREPEDCPTRVVHYDAQALTLARGISENLRAERPTTINPPKVLYCYVG